MQLLVHLEPKHENAFLRLFPRMLKVRNFKCQSLGSTSETKIVCNWLAVCRSLVTWGTPLTIGFGWEGGIRGRGVFEC